MKNIKYIIIIAALVTFSCSGFLDEVSQDQFRPTKVEHYNAMLLQEFVVDPGVLGYVQFMTDEAEETQYEFKGNDSRRSYKPLITWQRNIELLDDGRMATSNNRAWGALYQKIAISNYIIENIDEIEGTEEDTDFLIGEAFFIRAFCYFNLTNLYAEPYRNADQARTTYGVPIKTDIGITPSHQKKMLDECYDFIIEDINQAKKFIGRSGLTGKALYHPSIKACDMLMSRVKLYMRDYDAAIEESTKVIISSRLNRLSGGEETVVISKNNPELIYSIGQRSTGLDQWNMKDAGLVVSTKLLNLYDEADLRLQAYFMIIGTDDSQLSIAPRKAEMKYTDNGLGYVNMMVSEAYLNRAEAYACTGEYDKAREDLKTLMSHRYKDTSRIDIPSDDNELLGFIFDERFREFCFDDHHRWFDLRRMDEEMRPVIEHRFSVIDTDDRVTGYEYYTLLKNDRNYTLSVPTQEKNSNPLIRDHERYDKMPEFKSGTNN